MTDGCIVSFASSLVPLITTSNPEFVAQPKDLVQTPPLTCSSLVYDLMTNCPHGGEEVDINDVVKAKNNKSYIYIFNLGIQLGGLVINMSCWI